jgi:hypothetical protein
MKDRGSKVQSKAETKEMQKIKKSALMPRLIDESERRAGMIRVLGLPCTPVSKKGDRSFWVGDQAINGYIKGDADALLLTAEALRRPDEL